MDTLVLNNELSRFKDNLYLFHTNNSMDIVSVKIGTLDFNDLNILFQECYRIIRNKGRLVIQFRDVKEMCDKVNYSNVMGDISNFLYVVGEDNQVCGINSESLTKILSLNNFKLFKETVLPDGINKQNIYVKEDRCRLDNLTFHTLARYLQISIKALNHLMDNLNTIEKREREIYLTEEEYNDKAVTSLIKQLIDPLLVLEYDMPTDRILLYKKTVNCLLWDEYNYEEAVALQTGIMAEYNKWLFDYFRLDIKVITPEELKDEDLFDAIIIDKNSKDKSKLERKLTEYGKFIEV